MKIKRIFLSTLQDQKDQNYQIFQKNRNQNQNRSLNQIIKHLNQIINILLKMIQNGVSFRIRQVMPAKTEIVKTRQVDYNNKRKLNNYN
jgi:hypothetical protein